MSDEWIRLDDEQPKGYGDFLVYVPLSEGLGGSPIRTERRWTENRDGVAGFSAHINVTHWQPLPKTPKS